mmetsp:Transcript_24177/g.52144  ORF Transcript_24177/g.52144 Transcript_24177/m.52144 type:complete len:217 (-) Transcript_24177:7-657(-)
MRRFIKLTAVWVVLLAVSAQWWLPLFLREFALKRSMKINRYSERTDIPKECPSFESIAHESVLSNKFDYQKYNGVWFNFASNEPTQQKGSCHCDQFTWNLTKDGDFMEKLETRCQLIPGYSLSPITAWLEGKTNDTGHKASMLEGAPSMGADLIPNHVVWVSEDYSACIRFSCQENYLGVPVFSSVQLWARTPLERESKRGKALLRLAHQLLDFFG